MAKAAYLIGQRFHRLVVVAQAPRVAKRGRRWLCKCDCGGSTITSTHSLKSGLTKSCTCYRIEQMVKGTKARADRLHQNGRLPITHPLRRVWSGMKTRCLNPNAHGFHNYGGRGIKVCDRWMDFTLFVEDMSPRPSPQHSMHRIDNDGNYEPGNVRWATRQEQSGHRRCVVRITYHGQKMPLVEAWRKAGSVVTADTVKYRISAGWSVEDALEVPDVGGRRIKDGEISKLHHALRVVWEAYDAGRPLSDDHERFVREALNSRRPSTARKHQPNSYNFRWLAQH